MKAIVKANPEANSLEVAERPMPSPGTGELLIKMKAAGICYSDDMILTNKYQGRQTMPVPLVLGHEGAGVVAGVGPGVEGFQTGDRVGLNPLWGCGHCVHCQEGWPNMCKEWRHLGITCDGMFADYRAVPSFIATKLPESVSLADAACLEPIALTVRTLDQVKPRVGDIVAIIGPGSLGLFHLQAFRSAGAITILIGLERDATRLGIAKQLGADHIVNGSRDNTVECVHDLTHGLGADIVVETANHPSTVPLATELAAARGRVALFGLYPQTTISPLTVLRNGLTVTGDVGVLPAQFLRALRWVEYKKVLATPMVTRRFTLDQAQEGFDAFHRGETVKVLFEM